MELLKHDIPTEFPHLTDKIKELRANNGHFAKLYTHYDEVNKDVQKVEFGTTVMADEGLEELKKQRLKLKDEIVQMLQAA